VRALADVRPEQLTRADRWILDRLDAAIAECDAALGPARPPGGRWPESERTAGLRLNEYAEVARRFVWNELADWYVESTKARIGEDGGEDREVARAVLVHTFDQALRLLHPIVPFITEALWQRLPTGRESEFLAVAAWPRRRAAALPGGDEFEVVREAVGAIRQIRSDYAIPPGKVVDALLVPGDNGAGGAQRALEEQASLVGFLARSAVRVGTASGEAAAEVILSGGNQVVVPLAGVIDVDKECKRLQGELAGLDKQLGALRQRLANENFTARAKPEVVEAERAKEREWTVRQTQLAARVRALCGA
jgi:valyl-tRNA synthetase